MLRGKRIGDLLIDAGLLTDDQLRQALEQQRKEREPLKLGELLVRRGFVREESLAEALSRQLAIDRYAPDRYPIDMSLTSLIPAEEAQRLQVVPLRKSGTLLIVAVADPTDIQTLDALEAMTDLEVEPVICTRSELTQLMSGVYGMSVGLGGILEKLGDVEYSEEKGEEEGQALQVSSLLDIAEGAPAVRMVNWIISQAVRQQASDIHISPEETYIQVRFRIDGRLREIPALPKGMLLSVISRIKIIAGMDIAVSRVPQDGRFSIRVENHEVHVRASVVPTVNGENAVLRLLDMSGGVPQLDRLGFQPEDAVLVKQAIARPHGLILTTGPTGSGKTTTLYAILGEISSPEINVSTLEDPVEYRLANIRQLQLNRKAGMTFAGGLRALLRQDPDVIMVGEIRDTETAAIAVQAALTGHKVLSTLHTNDSPGAVVRLLDMGVAPFLVSSVLVMIVAQRLVRTVCKHCAIDAPPSPEAIAFWGLTPEELEGATFRRGTGCQNCSQTGYSGRIGIYEVLVVDNLVKGLIAKGRSAEEMEADLTSRGSFRPLKQDAVRKVLAGLTTLEEAASVVMV